MNFSSVNVLSSFGHEIRNKLITHDQAADYLTVLFPGGNNTYEHPLLYYPGNVAFRAGSDLLGIEYGYHHSGYPCSFEIFESSLKETLEALRRCDIEKYRRVIFISKSFGTVIAGEATRQFGTVDIRNLFLTPIARTVPYINEIDCTVVYGTADPHFTQDDAGKITGGKQVIALPEADHSLQFGSDYRVSLEYLIRICEITEGFL